jgi:hypothetical protein
MVLHRHILVDSIMGIQTKNTHAFLGRKHR